jgi:mRNA interferase RelE/StbE
VKTIVLTLAAMKMFDALPQDVQLQIGRALDAYAMSGRGDIKALRGQTGYRLRVGRYRVIFDEDSQTILAFYIGKRETTTYG